MTMVLVEAVLGLLQVVGLEGGWLQGVLGAKMMIPGVSRGKT